MRTSLRGLQHFILLGVLLAFSFAVGEGPDAIYGRLWWLVGCGLFLLWQPLVSAEQRLSVLQVVLVLASVAVLVLRLDWAWLAASVVLLASLIGGKVVVARERRLGWYYLLAFGYLCLLLFIWISPRLYGSEALEGPALWTRWLTLGVLVVASAFMPWRRIEEKVKVFDFLVSLLILLILSSVLMAVGILVAVERITHIEALVRALVGLGGAVLLLSWIWNPRLGFGGFGPMASRYLLRLGFPFEEWLRRISEWFDREQDPDGFLDKALESFSELPWVVGGVIERGKAAPPKAFGEQGRYRAELEDGDVKLVLFTSYDWSSSLIWQAHVLFKLVVEFYRARQRDQLLRQLQYVQAVYETGSRVTHDVKNLLQSLEGLCFALESEARQGHSREREVVDLVRRQLPAISLRLRSTLEKLTAPSSDEIKLSGLEDWWQGVQLRYQARGIGFALVEPAGRLRAPVAVLDNVTDNLIANALQKRLQAPELRVSVSIGIEDGELALRVADDGEALPETIAKSLFRGPVGSESGLGVGLFHAAQLASRQGYRLSLEENRPGRVVFLLAGPLLT
jgi:signal transduction histidine kinase